MTHPPPTNTGHRHVGRLLALMGCILLADVHLLLQATLKHASVVAPQVLLHDGSMTARMLSLSSGDVENVNAIQQQQLHNGSVVKSIDEQHGGVKVAALRMAQAFRDVPAKKMDSTVPDHHIGDNTGRRRGRGRRYRRHNRNQQLPLWSAQDMPLLRDPNTIHDSKLFVRSGLNTKHTAHHPPPWIASDEALNNSNSNNSNRWENVDSWHENSSPNGGLGSQYRKVSSPISERVRVVDKRTTAVSSSRNPSTTEQGMEQDRGSSLLRGSSTIDETNRGDTIFLAADESTSDAGWAHSTRPLSNLDVDNEMNQTFKSVSDAAMYLKDSISDVNGSHHISAWIESHESVPLDMITVASSSNYVSDQNRSNWTQSASEMDMIDTTTTDQLPALLELEEAIPFGMVNSSSASDTTRSDLNQISWESGNMVAGAKPLPVVHYYSTGRLDRTGMVLMDMLHAAAFVYGQHDHHGIYMGACGRHTKRESLHRELIRQIGLQAIIRFACPATGEPHVMLDHDQHNYGYRQRWWTADWIQHVRSQRVIASATLNRTSWHDDGVFRVAVHVRRGDVTPCSVWKKRYIPNAHYLRVLDEYLPRVRDEHPNPPLEVVIFSEHDSYEPWNDFTRRNYTLRLDHDLFKTWQYMMTADIFVVGWSTFSLFPAIFNTNQVIYTPYNHAPLPDWTRLSKRFMSALNEDKGRLTCPALATLT